MIRYAASVALVALVLAGCTAPADVREPNAAGLTVTSANFADGARLP